MIVGGVVLVLALAGYIAFREVTRRASAADAPQAAVLSTDLVFTEEVRTQWFSQGDGISVPVGGKSWRIVLASVGNSLTLKAPGGTVDLGLGQERYLDLDGDSIPDIRIVWNDADRTTSPKRVNLGLYRTTGVTAEAASAGDTTTAPPAAPNAAAAPPVRIDTFKPLTLAQAAQPGLFTLDLTFKNDCLFRYLVDDGQREDRFFQKGEQFSIDTGKKKVTMWLSNAGAVRMRVQGKDFELGSLGEVATRKAAWSKDANTGGYVLELTALY
jgi:hypothetical protein